MNGNESFMEVIRNKGFLNLWVNQILVQLAYNSLNFALIIWVFRLTNSSTAVSALLLAVYLPAVIFGLFAGVLIDVIDRRKIIIAINFCLLVLFVSLIFFKTSYPAVLLIAFLINTLSQFYTPAESSAIPLVVKNTQLLSANSLFSTTLYVSFLLGFGLAGPLINFFGINFIFTLGSAMLFSAFLLAFKFPSITNKSDKLGRKLTRALKQRNLTSIRQVAFTEINQTIRLVRGKLPVLFAISILSGAQAVIGVLAVLIPSFLERTIQIKATDASYILIMPLGLGMVVGGFLIGKIGYKLAKRRMVGLSILLTGGLFFAAGVAPLISPVIRYFTIPRPLPFFYQPPLSAILAIGSFLLGIAMVAIIVPSQTVLQENTPEQVRGKVFAVLGVAMAALSLLPVLFTGILADVFGAMPIFIGMGGLTLIFGLLALKPSFFFNERHLTARLREFLGSGHWKKG